MDLILDTSALLAILLEEPTKPRVIAATRDAVLFAPGSLDWEVGNAVAALFKRKRLTLDQALHALAVYEQIPIRLVQISLSRAVRIAHQLGIYAYDAYMLAAAIETGFPLLTLDGPLIRVAAQVGVQVKEVES
jgi:predicted nucleic acid-binding protein